MKSNFRANEVLYVKGIGYARLAIDSQKNPNNSSTVMSA